MDTSELAQACPRRRRRFTHEYKRRILEEYLKGPDSVSVVARRHDANANANQLLRWRRRYRPGELAEHADGSGLSLVPIRLAAEPPARPSVAPKAVVSAESGVPAAVGYALTR